MAMFWSAAPNTEMDDVAGKYKSGFRKSTERGHAGFYEVTLEDHNIHAELTNAKVGIHRYTLNEPDTLTWIVDLDHRTTSSTTTSSLEEQGCCRPWVSKNWAEEQHLLRHGL